MSSTIKPTPRKLHSYKEERLKSARKDLNESVSINQDLDEIESSIKTSFSRRLSNPTLNLMRMSLQKEISACQTPKSSLSSSHLRLSNVNSRFISKYMNQESNIAEVCEEEHHLSVLQPKSINTNLPTKNHKKMTESVRVERTVALNVKAFGKMTESRIVPKRDKKRGKKVPTQHQRGRSRRS